MPACSWPSMRAVSACRKLSIKALAESMARERVNERKMAARAEDSMDRMEAEEEEKEGIGDDVIWLIIL
jgi:hypothetical protein